MGLVSLKSRLPCSLPSFLWHSLFTVPHIYDRYHVVHNVLWLSQQLEDFAFDFLSGNGDYLDIANFINPGSRPDVSTLSKDEIIDMVRYLHVCVLLASCH